MEQNGRFAVACTDKEGRIWKLPEGTLVYRFQQTANLGSVAWNVLRDITITPDARYAFASGMAWNENVLAPVDLATGKPVGPGKLRDSLLSGAYQMRLGARSEFELDRTVLHDMYDFKLSKVIRKRDYDYDYPNFIETIELKEVIRDVQNPGSTLICFMQQYCRDGRWLKDVLKQAGSESYKEHMRSIKKANHCQYMDLHVVRFNPLTGETQYLGQPVPGVQYVDYATINQVFVSPFGDVVTVQFQRDYRNYHVYNMAGKSSGPATQTVSWVTTAVGTSCCGTRPATR